MTTLNLLKKELETLNLPWHIGHISEDWKNPTMDVEDNKYTLVAENSSVAGFICNAPSRIQKLIEVIEVQQNALAAISQEPWSLDPKIKSSDISWKAIAQTEQMLKDLK